jgi:hypothetical protein
MLPETLFIKQLQSEGAPSGMEKIGMGFVQVPVFTLFSVPIVMAANQK